MFMGSVECFLIVNYLVLSFRSFFRRIYILINVVVVVLVTAAYAPEYGLIKFTMRASCILSTLIPFNFSFYLVLTVSCAFSFFKFIDVNGK